MRARERTEAGRAATPLELFFDLCFVVAVSLAAARLHHSFTEGHLGPGLIGYLTVFFAVWWAWMNFTWFASAYDIDDAPYRLATLVQIAGALVMAAGIPAASDRGDLLVVTLGYVVMRFAMVGQWLRAARSDEARRRTAWCYAAGISVVQVLWLARLALPGIWGLLGVVVLALAEIAVPAWAERREPTTWHPGHIAERYGCFTLIVLGEVVLGTTVALQHGFGEGRHLGPLLSLAAAGIVIVFSMWWLYFDEPAEELLSDLASGLRWGYGHYAVFASVAAVGVGLEVSVDYDTGNTTLGSLPAAYTTAVPVAVFLIVVWLLHVIPRRPLGWRKWAFPVTAFLVLSTPFGPAPIHVIAVLLAALVTVRAIEESRGRVDDAIANGTAG
jgi:low temperature requirement protein LtrA